MVVVGECGQLLYHPPKNSVKDHMAQNLLIVESPSKAGTLKKYLGKSFDILASYGHVRDLRAKEGAVNTNNGFDLDYDLVARNKKHVDAIAKAVKASENIYLATDPDREGEAIAWHLAENQVGVDEVKLIVLLALWSQQKSVDGLVLEMLATNDNLTAQ